MKQSSRPMVTTIIPTYRRPKLLRRAIMSVLNQTYPHLLVYVCDNASGDETASVVAEIAKKDPRVKYFCNPENIGIYPNFQSGMNRVKTPYFSFLSDDDVLLPHFFETALAGFEKYPDAMFSAGATIYMTNKGEARGISPSVWVKGEYCTPPDGLLEFLDERGITWTAILFRRAVIKETGGYDLHPDIYAIADTDFIFRVSARFPFVVSMRPCAIYMLHSESFCSTLLDSKCIWPGGLRVISNLRNDERIPLYARQRAEEIFTNHIKSALAGLWIETIKRKNFKDAYNIGEILGKEFNQKAKARFIRVVTGMFEHVPPLYYPLNAVFKIHTLLNRKKSKMQEQFGSYAKYLELDAGAKSV